jgi:hypothetical protein
MCDDGTQRICIFSPDQIEFHDTWHTGGMRGTGSLDISVTDAYVPAERSRSFPASARCTSTSRSRTSRTSRCSRSASRRRVSAWRVGRSTSFAIWRWARRPSSRRAPCPRAGSRRPSTRAPRRGGVLLALCCATRSGPRGTRRRRRPVPVDQRVAMRLAAAHAAAECVAATDVAWMLAGGSAVYDTSVLGRCVRDAHVVDAAHHGRAEAQRDARQAPPRRRLRRPHDLIRQSPSLLVMAVVCASVMLVSWPVAPSIEHGGPLAARRSARAASDPRLLADDSGSEPHRRRRMCAPGTIDLFIGVVALRMSGRDASDPSRPVGTAAGSSTSRGRAVGPRRRTS